MKGYDQWQYILNELDKRERKLKAKRQRVPVVLGDEDDNKKAGVGWVLGGVALALIEFGLAWYCFSEILHLGAWLSIGAALLLATALPVGVKLILERLYTRTQSASTAAQHIKDGD